MVTIPIWLLVFLSIFGFIGFLVVGAVFMLAASVERAINNGTLEVTKNKDNTLLKGTVKSHKTKQTKIKPKTKTNTKKTTTKKTTTKKGK